MKKVILIILLSLNFVIAQINHTAFSTAIDIYKSNDFGTALKLFKEIISDPLTDEQKIIASKFYSANCLLNLDQLDGAASELESFIEAYQFTNLRDQAYYLLGTIYFQKGEFRKSRERLIALVNEFPQTAFLGSAYYWLGEDYFSENKFVEAEENFMNAITNESTNKFLVNSIYSLGQTYEKINDYQHAVKSYDELLTYHKNDILAPKSQMRIGICYFNLKDYNNAILELNVPIIQQLSGQDLILAKYFLANSYSRLKEYSDAIKIYNQLLILVNDESTRNKISYSLAQIYFQQEKYGDAYNTFIKLSDTADDSVKALSLFWSGECKRYSGDSKSANQIFTEFTSRYPGHNLAAKAQLGIGASNLGNISDANVEKSLINATISNDKQTRCRAYTLLGELRLNKNNYSDSKKYFAEALKYSGDFSDLNKRALLGLSVSEFYLNNYTDAEKYLDELKTNARNFEPDKVNFYLAETYLVLGKFSAALRCYNSIDKNNESLKKQVVLGKAFAYFNSKDFTNSAFYFNEFVSNYKTDPNKNEATLRLADSYFCLKNFTKASQVYKELFSNEKLMQNNDLAYYQFSQSLYKSGKLDEALDAFGNLQIKFPQSKYADGSQYLVGWIYFQQQNFEKAISNYNKLLVKYPRSSMKPVVYNSIGDSYYNSGQYDSSISYYSKVLNSFPNTQYVFDAVTGIQYAYVAKDQPDSSIIFLDKFINSNPNSKFNDQIFFKKGDLYYSIQKYQEAIETYKDFCSKYPASSLIPNAYYWIGKSAANLKNDDEALQYFNNAKSRALNTDIGISSAIELSKIYSSRKDYSSAINVLKSASDAVPTSNRVAELLFLQGINLVSNNNSNDAKPIYEQIITYYDGSIFAAKSKVEIGKLELHKKNYADAQLLFKDVGEKRTDDIGAQAQYYYGVLLLEQNKIEDAITALVRVRSVFGAYDEWFTKSLLRLGDCYIKLKDKKQAREMFRAVLIKHESGEFADEAKKKLRQL